MPTDWFRRLLADDSGVSSIEYALIAAIVSIAATVAIGALGTQLTSLFGTVAGEVAGAGG